jgi:hypothetical protein
MRSLRLTFIVVIAIAALVAAGCGSSSSGPSKTDFNNGYKPLNAEILAIGNVLGTTIQTAKTKSDVALATAFESQATRLDQVKTKLAGLKAPDDYKSDVAALDKALGTVSADLHTIASTAKGHDAAGARAATQKLVADSPALRDARRALAQKTGATTGP